MSPQTPKRPSSQGGPIRPERPIKVTLDDAECVVAAQRECVRADVVHEAYHAALLADTRRKGPHQ